MFGAIDSLRPGDAVVVIAHHDPLPLLKQADSRFGSAVTREYVEEGPEAWKVKFTRAE